MICSSILLFANLWQAFVSPAQESKPWTYWFWSNTLTDRATITEEAADIARLGFGGILLTDSRGYWNDENHLIVPPATIRWGSDEWVDLVVHALNEASTHGLRFIINIAASGGHLRGDEDTGADGVKLLKCRRYLPGDPFERPKLSHYSDIAVFAVRTAEPAVRSEWEDAGDGFYSMELSQGKREGRTMDFKRRKALEAFELKSEAEGRNLGPGWTVVRFGRATAEGREHDVDILDCDAVRRHLDRVFGKIVSRVPRLVGKDRTFAGLYNVSWEGAMPTWSVRMCHDFERVNGFALRPRLPVLAGYDLTSVDTEDFMRRFRHARGIMMKDHLYGTVREWANARGMVSSAESGGPWGSGKRNPAIFGECDQLAFLGANDIPQGEFWPLRENGTVPDSGHACRNGRYLDRAVVSAARIYGLPICAAEAFTHMHRHWSVDPAFLKPVGDVALANGINRLVWHTYTSSPSRYRVPGLEYFAGSHINRNVTWHDELPAFVGYLHRCQSLLQRGKAVVDVAILVGDRSYTPWGRRQDGFQRNNAPYGFDVTVPRGFASDVVNDEAMALDPRLLERYRIVYDARKPQNRGRTVPVGRLMPDVETPADWLWVHRRDASFDWYFLAGEGRANVIFRTAAPVVEVWDAVSGVRRDACARPLGDGRTEVELRLPKAGSCFVVFSPVHLAGKAPVSACPAETIEMEGPWRVTFRYHAGITAQPPGPMEMDSLTEFTRVESLRHFSGTAAYRNSFDVSGIAGKARLCLSELPSGAARVIVNGVDCGTVWCAPWEIDVTRALKAGHNDLEIRYVNNWCNRFVGDCRVRKEDRVAESVVRCWERDRVFGDAQNPWSARPTLYSGFCGNDPLQPSGLLGPVVLKRFEGQ